MVKVNPSVEASPSGVGAEFGEVELCQFSATVCPDSEHNDDAKIAFFPHICKAFVVLFSLVTS